MNQQKILFEKLNGAGVDIEGAITRFMGNQDFFLKFFYRFPEEWHPQIMLEALERNDEKSFHEQLHSLKGVSGNLGLQKIYNITEEILVEIRKNKLQNIDFIRSLFQKLRDAVQEILNIIENKIA